MSLKISVELFIHIFNLLPYSNLVPSFLEGIVYFLQTVFQLSLV